MAVRGVEEEEVVLILCPAALEILPQLAHLKEIMVELMAVLMARLILLVGVEVQLLLGPMQ
tara:strand:+ start:1074 stop:1256 length:183 start_codon:yes stop_codon:yes gene_type:complete